MTNAPDAELLAEFARNDSGAAFATLVERHIGLVYSVALRHTANPQLAQDITQAVFIVLARKAGALGCRTVLPGWLYRTARLTTANFQREEARRVRREQEAFMQSTLEEPSTDALWRELSPKLDEAMDCLGGSERDALVLRYFQNKSVAEVGKFLGLKENAAQKRVSRALEKLRKFFAKHGVVSTAVIIAGAISANSVQAAPAGLAATVTATAAKGATISATITTLVKGTMKTMTWLKLKFAIGVGLAVLLAGGAATVAISQINGNDTKSAAEEILEKSQDAYAALSSYSDSGTIIENIGGQTLKTAFDIRLQRPNLYHVDWSQAISSYTSGGIVWSAGNGDFLIMKHGEYNAKPQKYQNMEMALAAATGVSGQASSTIPGTFFKQNWGNVLNPKNETLQKQEDEMVGGVDCYVISSSIGPVTRLGKTIQKATTTLWIGKQDFLIHQTRTVMEGASIRIPQMSDAQIKTMLQQQDKPVTPEAIAETRSTIQAGMKQAQAMMKSGKFIFTQTHENISNNQKFSPADFAP